MQNLRIVNISLVSSTELTAKFTSKLTNNLVASNVSIISESPNVPDSKVLKVSVNGDTLDIICQPLTSLAAYSVTFQAVSQHPFTSVNGDAILLEDGVANKSLILGPAEPDNPVSDYFRSYFRENIYNTDDNTTIVSNYVRSLSKNLSKALYDIRQAKNENYLSISIVDERKTRGSGPFDRLSEESAYDVYRVGRTPTGTSVTKTLNYTDFPSYPITLQRDIVQESLQVDSVDEVGKFNINDLNLNLVKKPVTKLNSVVFTLSTVNPTYVYNIEKYGYQILDSRYDQDYAFSYALLADNQIRLSDEILDDPLFSINNIIGITVNYEYKNEGIVINDSSLQVYTTSQSIREPLPPIINVFNLKHAPIVDVNGNAVTLNGVTFTDPNNIDPNAKHPAFVNEIIFRLNALPSSPGQYSIDYETGTVYVYGNNSNNDGTGPTPPLATYYYKFTFKEEQDYAYDVQLRDLVALPIGNLVGNPAKISFGYEQVLIPNVDYVANLHKEELTERVQNRILSLNKVQAVNSPITDVFRVYNETSGEIYSVERWDDNNIYYRYLNPPKIETKNLEKVTFQSIINELLFVDTELTNASSLRIFKILLKNNNITSLSEDSLAMIFNTSLVLSDGYVFVNEKWFNRSLSETVNINELSSVGEYCVDYANGIIYCAVSGSQDNVIGTASYKTNSIVPTYPHLISVNDIYHQIDLLGIKNQQFAYSSFGEGFIIPEVVEPSDELYLNNNSLAPYFVSNNQVGAFVNAIFSPGVTSQIKFVRGLYEYEDLTNSTNPINFANYSTSSGYNITVGPFNKNVFDSVYFDGSNYYVLIPENIPYLSPNITYTFSVVRASDSAELWNNSGTIVPSTNNDSLKLILPGINSPNAGDLVSITYTFEINDVSRVVVDYNKGDLYVDYTYLADEIIISYEYGDNVLDFRQNNNLGEGTEYYVSYRIGALRNALYKNFGNLINIPELTNFNIEFDRERYRDALIAAMTNFLRGPTLTAIKNIGQIISHIEPVVTESVFNNWSLGSSLLYPQEIKTTGEFQLLPAKYANGVLVNSPNQTITFPVNSNIRLEEGTFETWVMPEWNGLDNDAELTFTITKNNININSNNVFIGSAESHPEITNGKFSVNKNSGAAGTPNMNKDGVFIYYDKDISGNFNRWYVKVVDGYVAASGNYKFKIVSTGSFYDSKSINYPQPSNLTVFTGNNTLNLTITGGGYITDGITFISDVDHYLLDFAKDKSSTRFSIFKDPSGYLNFKVYDDEKNVYLVSADVSSWSSGELHHVATSWKLNNRDSRDEMHLFIDGLEVANIIKYSQKLQPYLHEKFRAVNIEEILGLANRDIVAGNDMVTTSGSNTVTAGLNFGAYQIQPGDTIYIDESGFSSSGYTILAIAGQVLQLNTTMPVSLTNVRYSVNRTQFTVQSDIDVSSNITVSTIHKTITGSDGYINAGSPVVGSLSINFQSLNVQPGYLIRIDDPSLELTYTIVQVSGNSVTITDNLPLSLSGLNFIVYNPEEEEIPGIRAIYPSYSISKDINYNNILTISNNVYADDLILIRTLGLNHRKVKQRYYVWGNNVENLIMTRLAPPISLDEAKVTKVILPSVAIGPANSTLVAGVFQSNNLTTYQPSNAQNGRTISVTISGNNVDFSTPVQVTVNGVTAIYTVSETISFTDYGTLDFINPYLSINYIQVNVKPLNPLKNGLVVEVKEKYPITYSEFSGLVPVVKYSYQIGTGYNLYSDGYASVRDDYNLFSDLDIGNYLLIQSPPSVAGFYLITAISADRKSLSIQSTYSSYPQPLASFTSGVYQVLNVNQYRSGLQNGFFTFEASEIPGQPYFLSSGFYEFEYETYTRIKMAPVNMQAYLGSDFTGKNQFNGVIDELKIYSVMLTDTRVGESIPSNQRSITKDYNSLKPLKKDANTLMLVEFDSFPFNNLSNIYSNTKEVDKLFQSSVVVNENFENSVVILDKPLILNNDGILNTKKEGTIEFWMSPIFDTANDPQERYYFDAFGAVVEEAVSVDRVSVKLSSPASKILSVKLKNGDPRIDYFAGGSIEFDTQRAIQEEDVSTSNNIVNVSKPILQVIKVQIIGDLTETDYFDNGAIGPNRTTIYLNKLLPSANLPVLVTYQTTENKNIKLNTQVIRLNRQLPYYNSQVVVSYIPKGLQGDRISIFKDKSGYMNFGITASGTDYVIKAPTRWAKNTWHRVKASYKINGGPGVDELRLFLDGYQYNNVLFGSNILFGTYPVVMGSAFVGGGVTDGYDGYDGYAFRSSIKFKDPINTLYIGTDYTEANPIFTLLDNLRISNVSRPIYAPYGEPIDVNYTSNLDMAFPVTSDLYTTYLLDFNKLMSKTDDFATLINRTTGSFDFSINILDSFGIVNSSIQVKEALEKLIKILKPANSKAYITYTR